MEQQAAQKKKRKQVFFPLQSVGRWNGQSLSFFFFFFFFRVDCLFLLPQIQWIWKEEDGEKNHFRPLFVRNIFMELRSNSEFLVVIPDDYVLYHVIMTIWPPLSCRYESVLLISISRLHVLLLVPDRKENLVGCITLIILVLVPYNRNYVIFNITYD